MSRIHFVRHAETDMAGTFCGHSDPELNAKGRAQIGGILKKLGDSGISAIYSSDLKRARQTAEAIADHLHLPVNERPGLREIFFGEWEGRTWSEVQAADPAMAGRWLEEYFTLPPPGGEAPAAFRARVLIETEFLRQAAAGGPIVVVTHGGVLQAALPLFRDYAPEELLSVTREYGAVVSVGF